MEANTLKELYVDHLRDIYSAENQITKALPKMAKKAGSEELKQAFEEHLRQTENQISRLEQIFGSLEKNPRGKKCIGMEGLIDEGKEIMSEKMKAEVMDAALIAAAQKVEHYEIAAYGTVRAYAELLGEQQAVDLLEQTLEEESAADEKLTGIAASTINVKALNGERLEEAA